MSGNLAEVLHLDGGSGFDLSAWVAWLKTQLIEDWRPGEWDGGTLLFTGDFDSPRTNSWHCVVDTCSSVSRSRYGMCTGCRKTFKQSTLSEAEFEATYRPEVNRVYSHLDTCTVERDGKRCQREYSTTGLCRPHHTGWIKASRTRKLLFNGTREEWIRDIAVPYERFPRCLIVGCLLERVTLDGGLCRIHTRRWRMHQESVDGSADFEKWLAHEPPYLSMRQFSLVPLSELVRLEVLYAIQQRDLRVANLDPATIRLALARLEGVPNLVTVAPEDVVPSDLRQRNIRTVIRDLAWMVGQGRDRFMGIEPTDKLVWDMKAVGYESPTRRAGKASNRARLVDFSVIAQPWLREAVMEWARSTRPDTKRFRTHLAACTVASTVLGRLPGGGIDPSKVRFAEMTLVTDDMRQLTRADGVTPMGSKGRRDHQAALYTILDFGRSAGLLDTLHGTFARHSAHRIVVEESNEDEIGKAIPESVIRQLDAQLDRFGQDYCYRGYDENVIEAMFQTVYQVLRDTGRRPREVVSLKRGCLEFEGNDCFLVWNNYKGKRHGRRLPITKETAAVIQTWGGRRDGLVVPPGSVPYLFPAITDLGRFAHMETNSLSRALRQWVDSFEEIHSEGTGRDGRPIPFERSKIFPYAFRHSYAQRHADAGVPIDVLKELMDHKSADTTARYYKVSLKRKQEAVKTMRLHVVDRHGQPAPMASNKAYEMRSVAVPFGGCVEPSNVKAGGHACPIRFQCAGCGFYRPDPSYLAAIEDQIRDLKADKETALAMGTDEYVVRNLQDQIDSFKKVAKNMHEQIDQLPDEEREELMESVAVLRKSRAARGRMLPLTVINRREASA
ncbi:tyrosine-type recombinase/integrase [Streptomyces anulatus]|uniref:tyrosine-type recombinase/integrase n=1 Tax=Streptomyces anulatus TaxID=1892 RepID=UPI00386F87E4|nr:site-specific integrase [Streptomyces anulatus]